MMPTWTPELLQSVQRVAAEQGFHHSGIAAAPDASERDGRLTANRFANWIDAGYAAEMQFLARRNGAGDLLRTSARVAMPWARSVVVCAISYNLDGDSGAAPSSLSHTVASSGWIAKYAWSGDSAGRPTDYHHDLLRRLEAVEAQLGKLAACQTRCYVDTGPLLERDFAARAGIGWIGKNTCVINQQTGSWMLLGVIVTSLPLELAVSIAPDRCGSCTRCIDACPTEALLAPSDSDQTRTMDASRCISYLTIEKKGSIPDELRRPMGRQVFGCDICQEVCPWNRRAPVVEVIGLQRRDELINPALDWLATLDQSGFKRQFGGSPLERTKLKRLHRNVAIAMGNSGDRSFIPHLEVWAAGDDPVLREASMWALQQLKPGSASIGDETTNSIVSR